MNEKPSSMLHFLGMMKPELPPDWKAPEIPNLSGVKHLIYNVATSGLAWHKNAKIIGVTVSTLDGQLTRFLPTGFSGAGNLDENAVKRFVNDIKGVKIYNANTGYDAHHTRESWDIDLEANGNTFTDIFHTLALLDDTPHKKINLDAAAIEHLGELKVPRLDERQHGTYAPWEAIAREEYTAQLIGQLVEKLYPMIDEQGLRRVHDLEDAVIPAVVEMEKNGAPIDMELFEEYGKRCRSLRYQLLKEVIADCGFPFNGTNASWIRLYEKYNLPITMMKGKKPGDPKKPTFKDNITKLVPHPIVQKARMAGVYGQLDSKVYTGYKKLIHNGLLHYRINQLRGENEEEDGLGGDGTITGRFSASPIQQVRNLGNHKKAFGSEDLFPRDLYVAGPDAVSYLAADAAAVQYRIFAHFADNPKVIAAYRENPWMSFHRQIHSMILPYKPDMIYENQKTMNFLKIFGGKVLKIAIALGSITEIEAEEIRDSPNKNKWRDPRLNDAYEVEAIYKEQIPEVEPLLQLASHVYMSQCDKHCNKSNESREMHRLKYPHRGFVKTIMGRRCRSVGNQRAHKAFCMVDQGSEGDIMKTKIVELHKARKHTGFRMRMTVHDEVSGDALDAGTLDKVLSILNVQSFPELRVPILFEGKIGKNWGACK